MDDRYDNGAGVSEIDRMVQQVAKHLTDHEPRELDEALCMRKHFFAAGKGDLGQTSIVKHQINTCNQPAVKQQVHWYPTARQEKKQKLVEDMLALGIIQPDGSTRFCIDASSIRPQRLMPIHCPRKKTA